MLCLSYLLLDPSVWFQSYFLDVPIRVRIPSGSQTENWLSYISHFMSAFNSFKEIMFPSPLCVIVGLQYSQQHTQDTIIESYIMQAAVKVKDMRLAYFTHTCTHRHPLRTHTYIIYLKSDPSL